MAIQALLQEHGMNISAKLTDERVLDVRCDNHSLIVDLMGCKMPPVGAK